MKNECFAFDSDRRHRGGSVSLASPADAQRRASAQIGPSCEGGLRPSSTRSSRLTSTSDEIHDILYLREEEKLARDVYLKLAERWQLPIFENIARAEQRHMDLVLQVIEVYGIDCIRSPKTRTVVFGEPPWRRPTTICWPPVLFLS